MIYIKQYDIFPSTTFKEELGEIIYYIKYKLKEPTISKKLYKSIIEKINSLKFMPERCCRLEQISYKTKELRKTLVGNYTIIFEVNNITRTGFYITYFSWKSKLFKPIIINCIFIQQILNQKILKPFSKQKTKKH